MRDNSTAGRGLAHTFLLIFGIFAAASLLAWTSDSEANVKARAALRSDAELERSVIPRGETIPVYVLVRFEASDLHEPHAARPPLNLSLVLDRSGSMADKGKIEFLREAAKMAVGSLGERDVVSVVEFDDRITLMWPASHVHDIARLKSEIDELSPRGSTNLAGGMQRGIDAALGAREGLRLSPETLSRVILLTDGLANTGLTDHGAIADLAARARDEGVRVSTIGLGVDYDEDLLQAIAEGGGGKYYYVESPVQLAQIFQNELKAAFATRARDVHLAFHGSDAVRHVDIVGFGAPSTRDAAASWPDFYAGETRTALIRLEVRANATGPLSLGRIDVAWRDAASGASGTLAIPINVTVSDDRAASERSLNKDVAVEALLNESERGLAGNLKLAQEGKVEEARKSNAAIIADLRAKNAALKDERVSRKIEAMTVEQNQVAAAAAPAAPPDAMANYVKASKQRLYNAKSGQRAGYVLKLGDKGLEVEELQQALAKAGIYKGKISGIYDKQTADAVKVFQKQKNEPADGVAGAATQAELGTY
jgi:Ca-activated chloride channel family protein